MRKIYLAVLLTGLGFSGVAQTETETPPKKKKKDWSQVDLSSRSADHLLIQLGYAGWGSKPDSINVSGFNRTFNFYLLFDFPFKTNPRISVAIGPGIGTDNIYFEETTIDLKNNTALTFTRDTIVKYKKYKLNTNYLEVPIELRFSSNPENMNSGFKFAIGAKVGTLLDAKVKAKIETDENGFGGYVTKEKSKKFFNSTRLAATTRIGFGNFTVFGTYTITEFMKEGLGPAVKPFSIGLTLSGL
jgi:Outer membrane protein beta-barrel domain